MILKIISSRYSNRCVVAFCMGLLLGPVSIMVQGGPSSEEDAAVKGSESEPAVTESQRARTNFSLSLTVVTDALTSIDTHLEPARYVNAVRLVCEAIIRNAEILVPSELMSTLASHFAATDDEKRFARDVRKHLLLTLYRENSQLAEILASADELKTVVERGVALLAPANGDVDGFIRLFLLDRFVQSKISDPGQLKAGSENFNALLGELRNLRSLAETLEGSGTAQDDESADSELPLLAFSMDELVYSWLKSVNLSATTSLALASDDSLWSGIDRSLRAHAIADSLSHDVIDDRETLRHQRKNVFAEETLLPEIAARMPEVLSFSWLSSLIRWEVRHMNSLAKVVPGFGLNALRKRVESLKFIMDRLWGGVDTHRIESASIDRLQSILNEHAVMPGALAPTTASAGLLIVDILYAKAPTSFGDLALRFYSRLANDLRSVPSDLDSSGNPTAVMRPAYDFLPIELRKGYIKWLWNTSKPFHRKLRARKWNNLELLPLMDSNLVFGDLLEEAKTEIELSIEVLAHVERDGDSKESSEAHSLRLHILETMLKTRKFEDWVWAAEMAIWSASIVELDAEQRDVKKTALRLMQMFLATGTTESLDDLPTLKRSALSHAIRQDASTPLKFEAVQLDAILNLLWNLSRVAEEGTKLDDRVNLRAAPSALVTEHAAGSEGTGIAGASSPSPFTSYPPTEEWLFRWQKLPFLLHLLGVVLSDLRASERRLSHRALSWMLGQANHSFDASLIPILKVDPDDASSSLNQIYAYREFRTKQLSRPGFRKNVHQVAEKVRNCGRWLALSMRS